MEKLLTRTSIAANKIIPLSTTTIVSSGNSFSNSPLRSFHWTPAVERSSRIKRRPVGFKWGSDEDMAWNFLEQKDGLLKPKHTIEEQIAYMESDAYKRAYGDGPIFLMYKRNIRGQWKVQPPPRLRCLDNDGRFNLNHACPVCRDEYLWFDWRNPKLIDQFLEHGTDRPLNILRTGLCREQYIQLQAQILKAKEHGTMPFAVEYRRFNYADYFPEWKEEEEEQKEEVDEDELSEMTGEERLFWESRFGHTIESTHPNPSLVFETHVGEMPPKDWDQWWLRHARRARVGRRANEMFYNPERYY